MLSAKPSLRLPPRLSDLQPLVRAFEYLAPKCILFHPDPPRKNNSKSRFLDPENTVYLKVNNSENVREFQQSQQVEVVQYR
jgi:hypothetical protein